ncbi:MAG: proline--tRNA ligase [Thermoplasmataceae archaeon]|jgi:prolyl-tRNA synthetase
MEFKKDNFSDWYNEIVETAQLSDKRYPVKGMNVWMPYGLKIMQLIDRIIREEVDKRGFDEVQLPLLITRSQLAVEFDHLKGFEGQVYWVTRGGMEPLEDEAALRPTSESAMYPMFSLWIRSHADLPFKLYQIVNTYRYETKHTRSFLRVREIHFFEAHTAHKDYNDAEKQISEYLDIMKSISERLGLNYLLDKRPDWDKFPGAVYTIAADALMPGGRTLQIGTFHNYGENFSRNYDITYETENGTRSYVSQTTYGMSERLLGAIIGIHGDDKGLILPPEIAPVQVIIVPIPSARVDTIGYTHKIAETLRSFGIRVRVDDRDAYTPGFKYNHWEMMGVPLRLEIGEREVEGVFITAARRGISGKIKIHSNEIETGVSKCLDEVKKKIMEKSTQFHSDHIMSVLSTHEINKEKNAYSVFWCGSRECSDKFEEMTEASCLGLRLGSTKKGKCIICGKDGLETVFSRTY